MTPNTIVPDRMLLLHDVQDRLPQVPNADGTTRCAFSARWVREHVAPDQSRIEGNRWCVSERLFVEWYARWVGRALRAAEQPAKKRRAIAKLMQGGTVRVDGSATLQGGLRVG